MSRVVLADQSPFARGGHRECFVDPRDPAQCIKIRRRDYPLEALRRDKGFPRNLKPLRAFDDNLEEYRNLRRFESRFGERVFRHVPRCMGFTETDHGRGLVTELIRDADGTISRTLDKVLGEKGLTGDLKQSLEALAECWEQLAVPSRHLLLHNIVVERDGQGRARRLVVIDGLGSPNMIPFFWLPEASRRAKARRKTTELWRKVADRVQETNVSHSRF